MKTSSVLGLAALALVAGAAIGAVVLGGDSDAIAREAVLQAEIDARETALAAERRETAQLREEVQQLRAERDAARSPALEGAPSRREDAPREAAAAAAAEEVEPEAAGPSREPRFVIAGMEPLVQEVDWALVGNNLHQMQEPIAALLAAIAGGKGVMEAPPETMGRLQELNGPLITIAMRAAKRLDTQEPNTAFTHPALMENAIAATLAAAGVPLSESQAEAVHEAAVRGTERLQRSVPDPDGFKLHDRLNASEIRQEFFDTAHALLDENQRNALGAPEVRGRVMLDTFSAGLMWPQGALVVPFTTAENLTLLVKEQLRMRAPWEASLEPEVDRALEDWLRRWPAQRLERKADALTLSSIPRIVDVHEAGRHQLTLMREIAAMRGMPAEKVRAIEVVLVPAHKPAN